MLYGKIHENVILPWTTHVYYAVCVVIQHIPVSLFEHTVQLESGPAGSECGKVNVGFVVF